MLQNILKCTGHLLIAKTFLSQSVSITLLVNIETIQVKRLLTLLHGRARIQISMSHSRARVLIIPWTILPVPSFLESLWFAHKTWLHYSTSYGVLSDSTE